ncbi:MAG: hypothetical protein AMXMBFR7_21220 [Planctomycetota bacterium]
MPESKRLKTLVSWSTGKDSAWMLHRLQQDASIEVVGLLTTFNAAFDRVAMHGTRRVLAEAQAQVTGLPLWDVPLPWPCNNKEYESRMAAVIERARGEGVTQVAFGDLFLEEIRRYRVEKMAGTGVTPIFPLWGSAADTAALAQTMQASGLKAVLVSVDPKQLEPRFAGRVWDASLLAELPSSVDPCGEKGEFHTFCFSGPCFKEAISYKVGEVVERDGFWFADVLPAV